MKKNLYKILGITDEEKKLPDSEFIALVKKRYRKIAVENHPDKLQGKSEKETEKCVEVFKDATEAYDVLSDVEKRRNYDRTGSNSGFVFENFHHDSMWASMNDFIQNFMNGKTGHNPFFFTNRQSAPFYSYSGKDARIGVKLDVQDVINGGEKKYKYTVKRPCPSCNGVERETCSYCNGSGTVVEVNTNSGFMMQRSYPCSVCGGKGFTVNRSGCKKCSGDGLVDVEESVTVTFQKGMRKGGSVVMYGAGHGLPRNINGDYGNLLVFVSDIVNTGEWEIDDTNRCIIVRKIPILKIITGCSIEIKCLSGKKINFTIPRNTKSGKVFRLEDDGLPDNMSGENRGSYLVIEYKYPSGDLSREEKNLIGKLQSLPNSNFL
jgi:molecular chaperone DnaJ